MKIDLHSHSTYSDGLLNIDELLSRANDKDVDVLALTDHDIIDGVYEAMEKSSSYNLKVIPGIELTAVYKGEYIHIVGLFKQNFIPNAIWNYSIKMKEIRKSRAIQMLENIRYIYNLNINFDLIKDLNIITRGNMLQVVIKSNPNLNYDDAIFYTSKKSKAYVGVTRFTLDEGLNFLKENNCITILAHPTLIKDFILEEVVKFPFDGIEARYPKNKLGEEEKFNLIAKDNNMFISAGSDFHGDIMHADIGTSYLNEIEYEIIKRMLEE